MSRAAVLGSPVAHSLSPVLHRAGYEALGLADWSYDAREVTEGGLAGFVAGLDDAWRGLSLTMPLKEEALALAVTASSTAQAAGAANTLVRRADGGWDADNTDVIGLERPLAGVDHGGRAVLLGSGATARSAILALAGLGVRTVVLAVRAQPRPETVAVAEASGLAVEVVPLDRWAADRPRLVVSTLPPAAGEAVTAAVADLDGATLLDVVYADWPTPLARAAEDHGATVLSGLEMLVHQGAAQFELFTGQPAPFAAMHAAGVAALGR